MQLLDRNPVTRLGMPNSPHGPIRDHQFFRSIDWQKLESRKLDPPLKPKLVSFDCIPEDVQNRNHNYIPIVTFREFLCCSSLVDLALNHESPDLSHPSCHEFRRFGGQTKGKIP